MRKYIVKTWAVLVVANAMGCGNGQLNTSDSRKTDTTADQSLTNKTKLINPKITPCLWVETKDAKGRAI